MKEILGEGLRWIDVEHPSKADIERIHKDFPHFHPLTLEDTLSPIQRPKIDELENYLFLVLHFPVFEKRSRKITSSEVDMFVGKDYVITLHDGKLNPLTRLVDEVLDDKGRRGEIFGNDVTVLVYNVLNSLLDYCFPILYKQDVNLDILEDKIFEQERGSPKLVEELSIERRNILNYRKIVNPQRLVLANLERSLKGLGLKASDVYFDDLVDHIEKIWTTLEEQKETVEGLHDENLALVNTSINEVVRIFTVITVIFTPPILIASIYGMNVPLPFQRVPFAAEALTIIMIGFVIVSFIYFRKRHWL